MRHKSINTRKEFEALVREHHRHCGEAGYQVVISMDGKILRGTIDPAVSAGVCLLAVYLPGEGITLAQIAMKEGQSEVSAAPTLLNWVDLRTKVVIGDALHTLYWSLTNTSFGASGEHSAKPLVGFALCFNAWCIHTRWQGEIWHSQATQMLAVFGSP